MTVFFSICPLCNRSWPLCQSGTFVHRPSRTSPFTPSVPPVLSVPPARLCFTEIRPSALPTPRNVHAARYLARELVSRRRSPRIHEERPAGACLCRSPTTLCLLAALCRTRMLHLLAALRPLQVLSPPPRVRLCVCVSAHTASEQHPATSPRRNAIPAAWFPGIGTG